MHRRSAVLALAIIVLAAGGRASAFQEGRVRAIVQDILSGEECVLDDGRIVRLVGVRAPRADDPPGPEAAAGTADPGEAAARARAALAGWIAGRAAHVETRGDPDRYGRVWGRLTLTDPVTGAALFDVAEEMLKAGHARMDPERTEMEEARGWLAAEGRARRAGLGLWALDAYAVRHVDEAGAAEGAFTLVEGFVREASEVRGRVFLNFGADWREDFTVTIPPEARAAFAAAGLDPLSLARRSVRVRGVVDAYNGPSIEIRSPGALEVLD